MSVSTGEEKEVVVNESESTEAEVPCGKGSLTAVESEANVQKSAKHTHHTSKRRSFLGEVDVLHDSIGKSLLMIIVPLILTQIMVRIYVLTDVIVLGNFGQGIAVAATGTTGAIWGLIMLFSSNIAMGADIVVSRTKGEGNPERIQRVIRTAFSVSVILSLLTTILVFVLARPLLEITDCPADIIDNSALYLQILSASIPANITFSFMSSVLRATGDMRRLLIYNMVPGLVNVVLNVVLILVLPNPVAAVAIASVISPWLATVALLIRLSKLEYPYRFTPKDAGFSGDVVFKMFKYGIPTAISASIVQIVSVQSQSVLNSFGTTAIAGNTAAGEIINFVTMIITAFTTASAIFMGQNIGANNRERVLAFYRRALLVSSSVGAIMAAVAIVFGENMVSLIIPGEYEAIEIAGLRIFYSVILAVPMAIRSVNNGSLQAYGATKLQMANSLIGNCGLQLIWLNLIFPLNPTIEMLFIYTPIAVALTAISSSAMVYFFNRRLKHGKVFKL
ncbi:MAG: MATE family efflux transporter [Clostridia bacterium]|nr:MATE family efflux transporter [Clostridia bacterium]